MRCGDATLGAAIPRSHVIPAAGRNLPALAEGEVGPRLRRGDNEAAWREWQSEQRVTRAKAGQAKGRG